MRGRTIVMTRALAQSADFIAELERYGARVVPCPTIEIVPLESYELLDEALDHLYGYDWVVFTSTNGVNYFMRRMEERGLDVSELDELRVCATGAATADRLRDAHVHVDVVPGEFKAEGVFDALKEYLGGRGKFDRLNFLIPRALVARDYLPQALEEAGARADVVPVYRTVSPQTNDRACVEAMLVGGAVDCITFTSASTVTNFAGLFDTRDLSDLLKDVKVACIGDITARTAADYHLPTDIQPAESTTHELARAIADFFTQKS